ncbi:site-specific DNA-methyltransferase [Faecalibacterium prausnitzii]|uniref:Site-specific DNA-methyltransferase n=2 Tax=Faecalibacterium prausnitzii TaxID=853 RepID=A0A291TDX7_9FIRM|nr:site-specific DNA-methyltransferase [Faecalibacterium prausnitzii]
MHSLDGVQRNIDLIGKLFPNAITEVKRNGKVEHAIDFDVLRQELSDSIVEGREERYQFTWPDKKKAMLAANAPITATLRPVVADSVGKDGTPGGFDSENLYIEGDNLEVLKLLQETYLGKVKMIYIDPPYNTGNDFVYEDDFAQSADEYMGNSGQYDEEGNRLVTNTENNGRFHTDWLNMIYPRLRLAKDLLTDDGAIFISIDDNEIDNIRKVSDEVFGSCNFYAEIVWQKRTSPDARFNLGAAHDYILVYAKNWEKLRYSLNKEPLSADRASQYKNPDNDSRGEWASVDITGQTGHATSSQYYEITTPGGLKMKPPAGRCWALSESTFLSLVADNRIWFGEDGNSRPRQKKFLSESEGGNAWTWWTNSEVGHNQEGAKDVKELLGTGDIFTNPKPVRLIKRILYLATKKDGIVLDFFSGSSTTAHAVMQLNAEDGGHRKFIMVQLPEKTDEKSEAYKAGYKNICEIGKERIRRAGRKIKEDAGLTAPADLDIGFRCLRLDSSNMENVYYMPEETRQQDLFSLVDNVKPDRTPEDLLFQVMLDLGVLLSSPIEVKEIEGKRVFNVAEGFLLACFDHDVTEETVKAIAQMKPYYAVFRDSSMANDSVATNFDQIFETYSPDTVRKVL